MQDYPGASALTTLLVAVVTIKLIGGYSSRSTLDKKRAQKQKSRSEALVALQRKVQNYEVHVSNSDASRISKMGHVGPVVLGKWGA